MKKNLSLNRNFLFPLMAFLIPLIVRAIPEVLMAPYVTGFDTMGHYVPTTFLWLNGGVDLWRFVATAPLFYSIVVFFVYSGGALTTVLKIIPPLLHGFLGLSVYGYAKRGLDWSSGKSMLTALLATLYFVALRVSWDMLRNELALILFFVALMLLNMKDSFSVSWKRYLMLSFTMCLVVLAHQLISVLMFGVIGLTVIFKIIRKQGKIGSLITASLPSVLVFLAIFYFTPTVAEYRLIFGFSQTDGWLSLFGFSSYGSMLASVAGFFLYCFLPLLPLIMLGAKRLGNFQLNAWVLLCVIGALIPMVSPSNLRWLMMLSYPFAFYISDALSRIKLVSWRRFGIPLHKSIAAYLLLVLLILGSGLILSTPENPAPYFNTQVYNGFVYQIPTSLLQNTVSIADCSDTANALEWLKSNMSEDSLLLSHRAFYGWALSSLNSNQVILYEYDNPEDTAKILAQEGHNQIYLIWWINGKGWYGQPTVSSSFGQIYRSGKIAIYNYT